MEPRQKLIVRKRYDAGPPRHAYQRPIVPPVQYFSPSRPCYVIPEVRPMNMPRYYANTKYTIALPPPVTQSYQSMHRCRFVHRTFRSDTNVAYWKSEPSIPNQNRYRLPPFYDNLGNRSLLNDRKYKSHVNLPRTGSFCQFCKSNGEQKSVYTEHNLKDSSGKNECPILRRYICDICGATGDYAHTKSYCPKNNDRESMQNKLRTPHFPCGRKRYLGKKD